MTHHPLHKTRVYTTAQVRELDSIAIQEVGIPGYTLMERAAQTMFENILLRWPQATSACVLCGAGNNGGDGYVLARLAQERGWQVTLLTLVDPQQLARSAEAGEQIHALAADQAAQEGERGLLASDVIHFIRNCVNP